MQECDRFQDETCIIHAYDVTANHIIICACEFVNSSARLLAVRDYLARHGSAVCTHAVSNLRAGFVVDVGFLSEYRATSVPKQKFFVRFFVPRREVAPLSQQGRSTAVQRACDGFTIESAFCMPEYN